MLALPSNFIGLFLVLLLLFCKAQHRNVVRSYASLAAQLHIIVFVLTPQCQGCSYVFLFGTVFASIFNNSCEGLNIKVTYCSKSSLEFLLCNLVRWIQKSCKSNISHSCEAEDIQGIDCCKVRKLSEFTANFLSKGKIKAIPRLSHMYSLFLFLLSCITPEGAPVKHSRKQILRPYFGWVATISLIHFVQISSWCYKAKKWWLYLCQNWNL